MSDGFKRTLITVLNTINKQQGEGQEHVVRLGNITITCTFTKGEWKYDYDKPFDEWDLEEVVSDMVRLLTL